ncbi:hypothetical protein D3C77_316290 [compost metagenome]
MDWKLLFTPDNLQSAGIIVGWLSGVAALVWNLLAHFAANRRKNALRITALYKTQVDKQIITVTFRGLESHASYAVVLKHPKPKNITLAEFSHDTGYPIAGKQISFPAELPMLSNPARDFAQATVIVNGADADQVLNLTFEVKHRLLPKVIARRRLPLHLT